MDNTTVRLDLTEDEASLIAVLIGRLNGDKAERLGYAHTIPYDIYFALCEVGVQGRGDVNIEVIE